MEPFRPQSLVELEATFGSRYKLSLQDRRDRIPESDQDLVSKDIHVEPTRGERFVIQYRRSDSEYRDEHIGEVVSPLDLEARLKEVQ